MMLPGIGQHLQTALGALRGGLDEAAGHAVLDLQRDAADVAAEGGPSLPQGLGDGEAEALAGGLLQDHVGLALEGVDLYRADVVDVGENEDVGVAADMLDDLLEVVQPSGSSLAMKPMRASCIPGYLALTARYTSTTPSGSFQGSKRDTCNSRGRSMSMPNWRTM